MADLIIDIVLFLLRVLVMVIFAWTGEMVLYLVTFGSRKPRWNLYSKETGVYSVVFSEISVWIGVIFWLLVVSVIYS